MRSPVVSASPSIEILGHGTLTRETVEADIAKVLAACADWTGEREIMRVTGLGKARLRRALALAGDRLERECRARNTCWVRWMYKRHEAI